MNVVPLDQADPLKPGIYFITAESLDLNSALQAAQDGLNSAALPNVEFRQLLVSNKVQVNRLTGSPEMMYCVIAIIKVSEDRSN